MKTFTIEDIRSWNPCYDPSKYLPEDWKGTAVDILKNDSIPMPDILWVVLRTELVSEKLMRLFAVWCYRQTLIFLPNQDPRCIEAANVVERYANGLASKEELNAAAASASAASAASSSYACATYAAYSAAYAADLASSYAFNSAASALASTTNSSAYTYTYSKHRQSEKLIEMIENE